MLTCANSKGIRADEEIFVTVIGIVCFHQFLSFL